jgi:hypothetical protein
MSCYRTRAELDAACLRHEMTYVEYARLASYFGDQSPSPIPGMPAINSTQQPAQGSATGGDLGDQIVALLRSDGLTFAPPPGTTLPPPNPKGDLGDQVAAHFIQNQDRGLVFAPPPSTTKAKAGAGTPTSNPDLGDKVAAILTGGLR